MAYKTRKYRHGKKTRGIGTIALFAFFIIILIIVIPSLITWNQYTNQSEKSRTSNFPFYYRTQLSNSTPDIVFNVEVQYPRAFLVVDDPVNITVTALLETPTTQQQISSIGITFENSLAYPVTAEYGIAQMASFITLNNTGNSNILTGSGMITWQNEGTYNMEGGISYKSGGFEQMSNVPVVIQIYPKTQLSDLNSNSVSIVLSIAIFAFTCIEGFDLFFRLWSKEEIKK